MIYYATDTDGDTYFYNDKEGKDIIGRAENYKPINIDNRFPNYIKENQEKYKEWIIN